MTTGCSVLCIGSGEAILTMGGYDNAYAQLDSNRCCWWVCSLFTFRMNHGASSKRLTPCVCYVLLLGQCLRSLSRADMTIPLRPATYFYHGLTALPAPLQPPPAPIVLPLPSLPLIPHTVPHDLYSPDQHASYWLNIYTLLFVFYFTDQ